MSYHVNHPTQARITNPKATRNKPTTFDKRLLRANFARKDSLDNFIPS
jgi:hypothetical protein